MRGLRIVFGKILICSIKFRPFGLKPEISPLSCLVAKKYKGHLIFILFFYI